MCAYTEAIIREQKYEEAQRDEMKLKLSPAK